MTTPTSNIRFPAVSGNAFPLECDDWSSSETRARDLPEADLGNLSEVFAASLRELISRRAYELAEERGFLPGYELDDWLRAEREVLAAPMGGGID